MSVPLDEHVNQVGFVVLRAALVSHDRVEEFAKEVLLQLALRGAKNLQAPLRASLQAA